MTDHHSLRHDLTVQTAVGRDEELASGSTLSRLENSATIAQALALTRVLLEHFIASRDCAPDEVVPDIDATQLTLQGEQEGAHLHANYDNFC